MKSKKKNSACALFIQNLKHQREGYLRIPSCRGDRGDPSCRRGFGNGCPWRPGGGLEVAGLCWNRCRWLLFFVSVAGADRRGWRRMMGASAGHSVVGLRASLLELELVVMREREAWLLCWRGERDDDVGFRERDRERLLTVLIQPEMRKMAGVAVAGVKEEDEGVVCCRRGCKFSARVFSPQHSENFSISCSSSSCSSMYFFVLCLSVLVSPPFSASASSSLPSPARLLLFLFPPLSPFFPPPFVAWLFIAMPQCL